MFNIGAASAFAALRRFNNSTRRQVMRRWGGALAGAIVLVALVVGWNDLAAAGLGAIVALTIWQARVKGDGIG